LLERVGAGGMGVVHRAVDEQTGTTVALKLLSGRHPHDIERARREAHILALLKHPAIVRHVADGTTAEGDLYVAMAWLDGATCADRLSREGFTLREAVQIITRVAGAVAAAHRAQVLHRDIKPSNVLLVNDDPNKAMLIDFGVSRIGDALNALTRTGVTIGTPGYMSPEQARGEREMTTAADLFGLGCLLYELATAKPAFSGMHSAAVLVKILFGEPVPLAQLVPEAPPALVALLARMLLKDASARISDCAELLGQLLVIGIPDGPRRSARSQLSEPTKVAPPMTELTCMVAASRGNPGDMLEPPVREQVMAIAALGKQYNAHAEILATGGVVIHLEGIARDVAARAAEIALALKQILQGWTITVSSTKQDVGAVAEASAALLTTAAMQSIFHRGEPAIVVDAQTATLISGEYELERKGRDEPRLKARK